MCKNVVEKKNNKKTSIEASRTKSDHSFHLKDRRIREKVKVRSFEVVNNIKTERYSRLCKTFVEGNFP